jgi:MoaA/NifB/PqqE/SkfB family radical SAM enzyme
MQIQTSVPGLIGKFSKVKIPLVAFIELTGRCNLKCAHCMRSANVDTNLPKTIFERLLSDLADRGTLSLVLTGGEPMLHPHFFDFLGMAKAKRFNITVNMNGTLITSEVTRVLKRFAPLTIQISLYGATAVAHDGITRIKGSFEKASNAIRLLKKTGHKVCVHMPVLKENFDDFEKVKDWAMGEGLEFSSDFIVYPRDDRSLVPLEHRITDAQMKTAFEKKVFNANDFCVDAESRKSPDDVRDLATYSCRVSSSGQVFPSGTVRHELGNLNERSFFDIWNGPEACQLRNLKDSDFDCYGCSRFARCRPDFGLAYAEHGRVTAIPKEWCRFVGCEGLTS